MSGLAAGSIDDLGQFDPRVVEAFVEQVFPALAGGLAADAVSSV